MSLFVLALHDAFPVILKESKLTQISDTRRRGATKLFKRNRNSHYEIIRKIFSPTPQGNLLMKL